MRLPGIVTHEVGADDWYTPPFIFDALGLEFDCDPAAPPGGVPWIPVDHVHTQEEDGLLVPWHGLVWLNPPYSAPGPWLARLRDHGTGVALVPGDSSTDWWQAAANAADAACFLRGRVKFVGGTDLLTETQLKRNTSARYPSVLFGFGPVARDAVADCGLGFVVA